MNMTSRKHETIMQRCHTHESMPEKRDLPKGAQRGAQRGVSKDLPKDVRKDVRKDVQRVVRKDVLKDVLKDCILSQRICWMPVIHYNRFHP